MKKIAIVVLGLLVCVTIFWVIKNITKETDEEKWMRLASSKQDSKAELVFEYYDRYKNEPWAETVIRTAASIHDLRAIEYYKVYKNEPFGTEVFLKAAKYRIDEMFNPGPVFWVVKDFKGMPFAEELIEEAATKLADGHVFYFFHYAVNYFKDKPYMEKLAMKAISQEDDDARIDAIEYFDKYKEQPYATKLIEAAIKILAKENPGVLLKHSGIIKKALVKEKPNIVQKITEIENIFADIAQK